MPISPVSSKPTGTTPQYSTNSPTLRTATSPDSNTSVPVQSHLPNPIAITASLLLLLQETLTFPLESGIGVSDELTGSGNPNSENSTADHISFAGAAICSILILCCILIAAAGGKKYAGYRRS